MVRIRIARVGLDLLAQVPSWLLDQHLTASARVVGRELAHQVVARTREEGLGYFPALDYFEGRPGVEAELLQAARDIAWFAGQWASAEVRRRLRGAFSSVTVQGVQARAFLMPGVRPREERALERLAHHYTPDTLRINLELTLLQRGEDDTGFDLLSRRQTLRLLEGVFTTLEVADARML